MSIQATGNTHTFHEPGSHPHWTAKRPADDPQKPYFPVLTTGTGLTDISMQRIYDFVHSTASQRKDGDRQQLLQNLVDLRRGLRGKQPAETVPALQVVALSLAAADDMAVGETARADVAKIHRQALRLLRHRLDLEPQSTGEKLARLFSSRQFNPRPVSSEFSRILNNWIHGMPYAGASLTSEKRTKNIKEIVRQITSGRPALGLDQKINHMAGLLSIGDRVPEVFKEVTKWIEAEKRNHTPLRNFLPLLDPFLRGANRVPQQVQGEFVKLLRIISANLKAPEKKELRPLVEQFILDFAPEQQDDLRPVILGLTPEDYTLLGSGEIRIRRREQPGPSGT